MDDLIEVVGLAESANAKVITLSGGLRRRLDVAIGIVGRPEVVFLDEPTAGFDPHARRDFHDLVHRLSDFENTTVLMTTHDLDEAEKVADRILVLDEGRIVADGSAEQLARELTTTAEVRWTSAGRRHVHGSVGRCREASRATRRDRSENLGDAGMTTATALDARWAAARAGFPRGWIETRQVYTETTSLIWSPVFPLMYVGVLLLIRGKTVPGTDFALGAMVLPSLLGVSIAFGGVVGSASTIAIDREDGTLLRAKATPNGMLGYLVGKIVMFALTTLVGIVAILVAGSVVVDGLVFDARASLLLTLIFIVGMVATVPIGVALGSLTKSSAQAFGLVFLPTALLILPSGIFTPITTLPTWLQWVGQALPFYWVGLGARSALLPAEMAAAEIGQAWRTPEMFAALGVWAVIGLVLAPILLRRMARSQSGSIMAATRERIMSKGY